MKKTILFLLSAFSFINVDAQVSVNLKLHHKLGVEDFELDKVGVNNLGHSFKATRLEYYISEITIVHDGTETAIPADVVALVRPQDEITTTIALGVHDVTEIEAVKFHVGVYDPANHGDPTLWPGEHPLAPKSPSMHWGWVAGYRFVVYEGFGGVDFSQAFQMHGLGDANYFEVTADVDVVEGDESLEMNLFADYQKGLMDIDLTSGVISHGETGEALTVLRNWQDEVFGNFYLNVQSNPELDFIVFPNPTVREFTVTFDAAKVNKLVVYNLLGEEVISSESLNQGTVKLSLESSGVYSVVLYDGELNKIGQQKVVVD